MKSVGMRLLSIFCVLLAALIFALATFSDEQDIAALRDDAARAMKELRYRDALAALEEIEKAGEAVFDDRNNILTCLLKLRENEQFDARLATYMSTETDIFNKARFGLRLISRVERRRYDNRARILELYTQIRGWLKADQHFGKRKSVYADVTYRYATFLQWHDYYGQYARILSLYNEIIDLEIDEEHSGKAQLGIASAYLRYGDSFGVEEGEIFNAFRRVVSEFPSSTSAVKAQFQLGRLFQNKNDFVNAVIELQAVIDKWPQSEEAAKARRQVAEIKAPRLTMFVEEVFRPGQETFLQISYRNVKTIELAAYRIDLISALRELKSFDEIHRFIDTFINKPEASWAYQTDDKGLHQRHSTKLKVPLTTEGAFVIEGKGGGLESRVLFLISGLATVVKASGTSALIYCTDALSGEPVNGAEILLASDYRRREGLLDRLIPPSEYRYCYHSFQDGRTDDSGLWKQKINRGKGSGSLMIIARRGNEYAVSDGYLSYWYSSVTEPQVYLYTDRPFYRPEQKVRYKAIVRLNEKGVYRNQPNQKLTATIWDSRGNKIKQETLVTNEFGTASSEFLLDDEAALGSWYIELDYAGEETYSYFRVEEYKKPEFKVTVTPKTSQYKLGDRLSAAINAFYYFGQPVADAEVEYEVRQNTSYWWYRPASEYEWLYGSERSYYYGGGRIVYRGTGKTDADGNLKIAVPTAAIPDDKRDVKVYDFSISAHVTDASRREIQGSGSAKVTSHEFSASVRCDRYVYQPGDQVDVGMFTRRYDGTPIASSGKLVLYQAEWNTARKEYDYTKVWDADASTDEKGEGSHRFEAVDEGYFFVTYETSGAYDNVISGRAAIWISSKYFHAKFFRHSGLEIIPDKEHYLNGETARLLVNSKLENVHALFTVETNEVIEERLILLQQGANLIELPIIEAYEPNVFVKVLTVKDFALYSDTKEIRVPPEEKFATLRVTPSKAQFKPGEKGLIKVEASDWKGNPLSAEFSIGVVDSAIYYFGEDQTADIRAFFYGRPRYDSVRTFSSFDFSFRSIERRDVMKYREGDAGAVQTAAAEEMEAPEGPAPDDTTGLVEPEVRKDFRDSALWLADVRTGPDGVGEVEIEWPDNLTTWRTTVRAVTKETVVGGAKTDVTVSKNLLVRLQTPRFLVQGDRVTLSANVHNYLDTAKRAKVSIEAEGVELLGEKETWLELTSGGERRFDIEAVAKDPGTARILVKALTDEESDALELSLPVYVHGMEKFAAAAGSVERSTDIELNLPDKIRPGSALLRLAVRPTIAGAMLDSLPYLIDYPYGCTEQTMSRFLPAAMVAKTLRDLGLSRPKLEKKLPAVIKAGLERLYDFQHSDGGWGWWKHDSSSVHMSAYVVYGLTVSAQADIKVDGDRLRRGIEFLKAQLKNLEDEVELLNYVLYSLSWSDSVPERYLNRVFDLLPKMRAYETALFAVTLHNLDKQERFGEVVELMEQRADVDSQHGFVSWGKPGGWYWYQDNVEATALGLMAELRKDPAGELVKGVVRWLLSVRKGGKWKSTRDTAFAIYALTEFIKSTDEFNPDLKVTVEADGEVLGTAHFTRENLFSDDCLLELDGEDLKPGLQKLRIVREGSGNLYYDAFLSYFSLEEKISAASTTIAVERSYYKLISDVNEKGREVITRLPLKEGDLLTSGDEIEVQLELTSENNYEYLVYEDFKPAGCEPVALLSGRTYGSLCSNLELRDEKVVFFIGWLPKGNHTVSYRLRAEIPGEFHALPTNGFAMYAPDVRAISDEHVMKIRDEVEANASSSF